MMKSVTASLGDLAATMPAQMPMAMLRSAPRRPEEPMEQFSFRMRKSLRRQLDRLAIDADVTMQTFVLGALREKGLRRPARSAQAGFIASSASLEGRGRYKPLKAPQLSTEFQHGNWNAGKGSSLRMARLFWDPFPRFPRGLGWARPLQNIEAWPAPAGSYALPETGTGFVSDGDNGDGREGVLEEKIVKYR
jgi:hypothetical protein